MLSIEKERPSWYPWLEWSLIILGIFLFADIGIWTDRMDEERKNQKTHRPWKEVLSEEQRSHFGIKDDWGTVEYIVPQGGAERFKQYIQKGGYSKETCLLSVGCMA